MKFSSPSGNLAQTAIKALFLLGLTAPLASAKVVNYRYLRFTPTALRDPGTLAISLSEFQFFNGATRIPTLGTTVTDPSAIASSPASNVYDNYLNSVWQNNSYFSASLTFDFGAPKAIDSYNFVTSLSAAGGDPVSWSIEGSTNGGDWEPVDSITNFVPTTDRFQVAAAANFVFPSVAKPQITAFEFNDVTQPFIVASGVGVDLYYSTVNATSAKITADDANNTELYSSTSNLDNDFPSIIPIPEKQGVYTLTATNAGGSTTRKLTIRAASNHVQSYQYVRYTPLRLRGGGTQIQLSSFDFKLNGAAVPVASVTNPGGTTDTVGEGVGNLIDNHNTATKWFTKNLSPVIFNFGTPTSFDSYSFTTANDSNDRDPVQWIIEGSNNNTSWDLLENITSPPYPTSPIAKTDSGNIPFSGLALTPPAVTLTSTGSFAAAGDPITLTYSAFGAGTLTLSSGVTLTGTSGTVIVNPTATTTYTLTSTTSAGATATAAVTINVVTPTGSVNFPTSFDAATDLSLVGSAKLVNDFATFPNGPNAKRVRLTDLRPNQYGAAWSTSKIKVTDGFETTFDAQISHPDYVNTVGGISFIIQNTTNRYNASNSSALYINNNAVSIALDTFTSRDLYNAPYPGETEANVNVYANTTSKGIYNLDSKGLKYARGYHGNYFVTKPTAAPYKVRISYTPGALSVYVDDKPVVVGLAVDLSTAADASGKAYVGFNATNGFAGAYQDIVDWTLTPGASTATPLAITASSFSFSPAQATLTFSSTSGKTYQITQSADLVTWTPAGSPVTAGAGTTSTTTTVPFTAGSKGFFRVEQTN
ncbi:MAG: symbB [Akkermansiaceae bacterium]|nr:symbB [Akkermansiaceae bacterium]